MSKSVTQQFNQEELQAEFIQNNVLVKSEEFFQLEFKFESFKQYLENITGIVNQHAKIINVMQGEISKKVNSSTMAKILETVAQQSEIGDKDLKQQLHSQQKQPLTENTGNELQDMTNKLANRINLLSQGTEQSYKKNVQQDQKLLKNERDIEGKLSVVEFKQKKKKLKQRIRDENKETRERIEKRVGDFEKKIIGEVSTFQQAVHDVQQKTLYKIKDCEELLKQRAATIYVDESIAKLAEQLRKEINKLTGFDEVYRLRDDFENQISQLKDDFNNKIKNNKQMITSLEEAVNKKFVQEVTYNQTVTIINEKINELQNRQKDMMIQLDFSRSINMQNEKIRSLEAKLEEFNKQNQEKINYLEQLLQNFEPKGDGNYPSIDIHKLCQLEANLLKLQDEFHEFKHNFGQREELIKDKLSQFNDEFFKTINKIKNFLNEFDPSDLKKYITKDEIQRFIDDYLRKNKLNENNSEQVKKNTKDIMELFGKIQGVVELEKKLNRLLRDLDINNLVKVVRSKADQDDVTREVGVLDNKIGTVIEEMQKFRKDIDYLINIYKRSLNNQGPVVQNDLSSMISTQKIVPAKCLGCGRGNNVNYIPNNSVKGSDGKYYKTDQTYNRTDQDFLPYNQQQNEYYLHSEQLQKSQNNPKQDRPQTAKNVLQLSQSSFRPVSAKK